MAPARFDAEQVYSPACLAATDSTVRTLFFLFVLAMTTSDPWRPSIGVPLKAQDISRGLSPLVTEHVTEISSPQLAGSSPNANGSICGATGNND